MALKANALKKTSYLTFTARGLLGLLGAFIIRAYFYPMHWIYNFTSSDQVMHFSGFAVLGFICAISFPKYKKHKVLASIVLLGIMLELAQPLFTAYRELSVSDMVANGSGGLIGYGLGAAIMFAALKRSP